MFSEQRETRAFFSRVLKSPELPLLEEDDDDEANVAHRIVVSFGGGVCSDRVGYVFYVESL